MKIGRQFEHTRSMTFVKADCNTSRQSLLIAEFCVSYDGIIVSYADVHSLASQIPRAGSLDVCGKRG
jgi:hypothetical protein